MASGFVLNTPIADALRERIQPKLVEIGWSVGGDDSSPLSEYICLMLVNGKTQDQIASELSGDLLGLSPDDSSAIVFATWLFDELDRLRQLLGEGESGNAANGHSNENGGDHEMHDGSDVMGGHEASDGVPTAPKAMRQPNGRRLMNQLNKALERNPADRLHRVQTTDRVDKFKRDPPKGPASNRPINRGGNMRGLRNNNGRGQYGFSGMGPNMAPEQQMALFQMFQQQAQMMGPGFGAPPPTFQGPPRGHHMHGTRAMQGGRMGMPGRGDGGMNDDPYSNNLVQPQRSGNLFERIHSPPDLSKDENSMDTTEEPSPSQPHHEKPPEEVACKFGNGCTKPDCPFAHPSPAAGPAGTFVSGEKCTFGVRCKNRKCTGSHPSLSSAPSFAPKPAKIDADCRFFPNCTNPQCPFKHPPMPMCRNGANCTRPDCHFTHSEIACKYKPCLNPSCIYRHEEGQQQQLNQGGFTGHKVWTANGTGHVSERKFIVGDEDQEELIIPGSGTEPKDESMDTAPIDADGIE